MLTSDWKMVRTKLRVLVLEGTVVAFDDGAQLRWCDQGDVFSDGEHDFEACMSGVFVRHEDTGGQPHWMYYGGIELVDVVVKQHTAGFSPEEFEGWYIGVLANKVLRELHEEKYARRG